MRAHALNDGRNARPPRRTRGTTMIDDERIPDPVFRLLADLNVASAGGPPSTGAMLEKAACTRSTPPASTPSAQSWRASAFASRMLKPRARHRRS